VCKKGATHLVDAPQLEQHQGHIAVQHRVTGGLLQGSLVVCERSLKAPCNDVIGRATNMTSSASGF
jgi:hypothetical protein